MDNAYQEACEIIDNWINGNFGQEEDDKIIEQAEIAYSIMQFNLQAMFTNPNHLK